MNTPSNTDFSRFEPTEAESALGIVTKNVCQCRICGGIADRHLGRLQCRNNSNHVADLNTGIFSDLSRK